MPDDAAPRALEFSLHEGEYALARLPRTSIFPAAIAGQFCAVVHGRESLTVVCSADEIPEAAEVERGFRCLEIVGSFELDSVGVVATATQPLSAAGVSLFAFSSWETDYILVHDRHVDRALAALTAAGHTLRREEDR
jgi:hypothetical protein